MEKIFIINCSGCNQPIYSGEQIWVLDGSPFHPSPECIAKFVDLEFMSIEEWIND